MRERFYVELAPGYVRLRHQLGLRTRFGRRGLNPLETRLVRTMNAAEDEPVLFGEPDPDDLERLLARDRQNQEAADDALTTMDPWGVQEYRPLTTRHASTQRRIRAPSHDGATSRAGVS